MAKTRAPAGSGDAAALRVGRGAGRLALGLLLALALTPGPRPAAAAGAAGSGDLAAAAAPYRRGAMRAAAPALYQRDDLAAAVAPYQQGAIRAAAAAPYQRGALRVAAPALYQRDDLAAAVALYQRGEMRAAAEVARRAGGAKALVLAARASLVDALYLADPAAKPELLERAVGDAREALALAPHDAEPHLQLAMALGALADWEGPIAAHLNGYAKEGHELLRRARELAPDDPWPDGLLGIWHLQIVRHGSAVLAAELYGASAETGLALCREAAVLAPRALALRYGCAVSLLDADPERFRREALSALVAIVRMPAADAAERLVQRAARERIAALRTKATP